MKKILREQLLGRTAVHESGHALICHILGLEIDFIKIDKHGNGSVECNVFKPTFLSYKSEPEILHKRMKDFGLRCLSGYVAEAKFLKIRLTGRMELVNELNPNDKETDFNKFYHQMSIANNITNSNRYSDDFFLEIQWLTLSIISEKHNWKGILRLADELIEATGNRIHGRRAHEILNQYASFGSFAAADPTHLREGCCRQEQLPTEVIEQWREEMVKLMTPAIILSNVK